MTEPWKNRIVGYSDEPPDQLQANLRNWRIHPAFQQDALSGVLSEVGVVQNVLCNRTTGNVVDGHLRISLALRENQPTVPVTWVELSEDEEAVILATLDPIAAMAGTDAAKLNELLQDVRTGEAAVQAMLGELAQANGIVADLQQAADIDHIAEQYMVLITCTSEQEQAELLERLSNEGLSCRALIS